MFVQSGGASQTAAAARSGNKTQLSSLIAAALVLLTGAFLAPLFKDLPQATLGAIVLVAVSGFFRVDELRRFAGLRRSAIVFALTALLGVLALGILRGLIVAAGLALVVVIQRLSRPDVAALARDRATGAWGRADRHPEWSTERGWLFARVEGPLFYANAGSVKDRILELARRPPQPRVVVLDLAQSADLDVETLDALAELADGLFVSSTELRLSSAGTHVAELLRRSGLDARLRIEPSLDAALKRARAERAGQP